MKQLIDGLRLQKLLKIQLIVVDDCSTDDSLARLKKCKPESDYLQIIIVENEINRGPGFSRNHGIKYATGEYITFVDSDDYLTENFYEIMVPLFQHKYDCIVFDYANVDLNGNVLSYGKSFGCEKFSEGLVPSREAFVYVYGSTCGKIYKRTIIENNNIQFADLYRNEDMPFTKKAVAMAETVYYCPQNFYCYVQHPASLMHNNSLLDEKNGQKTFSVLEKSLEGMGLEKELLAIKLREVLNNTVKIKIAKHEAFSSIRRYIKENYKKEHIHNMYFKNFPLTIRVFSYCAYFRFVFFLSLMCKYRAIKKKKMQFKSV